MQHRILSAVLLLFPCIASPGQESSPDSTFRYGVASGDPLPDRVLLWTYFTPDREAEYHVKWEVSTDSLFAQQVIRGDVTVQPREQGGRILVDAAGLQPATTYYYRFRWQDKTSRVGRTRTAPGDEATQLRLAVVSCQNYEAGFYNAYAHLARRSDIDAVLHLGDYIYEFRAGYYGNASTGRVHQPTHEIVTENDYMTRYRQYRLDPDLQDAHARFPFIAVWDDHEFANDSHVQGAQNHQPDQEGDWNTRREAARRAYYTWMPVRRPADGPLYRSFRFGKLAELWMLDERQEARSPQASSSQDPTFTDTSRHMLGSAQLAWLRQGMQASAAAWRIMGNQVILSSVDASKVIRRNPKFMDMWDGYPAERNRLFDILETLPERNIVVVSGDSHTSWSMDLLRNPSEWDRACRSCIGAEFTTPSITSANYDEYVPRWIAAEGRRRYTRWGRNPQVRAVNVIHHGYLVLDISPEEVSATWHFMRDIAKPDDRLRPGMQYSIRKDSPGVRKN